MSVEITFLSLIHCLDNQVYVKQKVLIVLSTFITGNNIDAYKQSKQAEAGGWSFLK